MIYLYTSKKSSRLEYVLEIIFRRILQIDCKIITEFPKEFGAEKVIINYTNQLIPNCVNISNSGFLEQTSINSNKKIQIEKSENSYKFELKIGNETIQNVDFELNFDIFSAIFYVATEYHNWANPNKDQYDRYRESRSKIFPILQIPIVHLYAEHLWKLLKLKNPNLKKNQSQFDYEFTFDIDQPWMFLHKPLKIKFLSLAKTILKGNLKTTSKLLKIWRTKNDPFAVYDIIFKNFNSAKTKVFFLINRSSKHDSRFSFKNKAFQDLIRKFEQKNYKIGIHPSFETYRDRNLLEFEKIQLESILNKQIINSRQHYLRYNLPETFQNYARIGLKHDYSICPIDYVGFKLGICISIPWFDLSKNEMTEVELHPSQIMDRTLQLYMKKSPKEAIESISKMINQVRSVNGTFRILMHNTTFSEVEEWRGWRKVFERILEIVSEFS